MTNPNLWQEEGNFNTDQYNFVKDLLSDKNINYALETGFATGRSALSVLNNCPNLKRLISVDINFDYHGIGREMLNKIQDNFPAFKGIESASREALTEDFFEKYYPKEIDYCLVDGDHSYSGCLHDLKTILPHVKKGGIILIDDYKSGPPNGCPIPEVTKACDDFHKDNEKVLKKESWNDKGKGFCIFTK